MPDELFADPRLARCYDALEGERHDLDAYVRMVEEFDCESALDVGCGTGTFACRLAELGVARVFGVDPAAASLDVAQDKRGSTRVQWSLTDARHLPDLRVDLVTMTGNVAQVFLADDEWSTVLAGCATVLSTGGRLVVETRDPERRAWRSWTRAKTLRRQDVAGVGPVRTWVECTEVDMPLVTFETHFVFEAADDEEVVSGSTLRFRQLDEVRGDLEAAGLTVEDVRDAPDRPGLEFVFVARRL